MKYIPHVVTITLDNERCSGCSMCLRVCPHAVFGRVDGRVEIVARERCMECGACSMNCPEVAIAVDPGVGCATLIISRWLHKIGIRKQLSGCC